MKLETLLPLGKVDPGLREPVAPFDLQTIGRETHKAEELGYDSIMFEETKFDPYVVMALAANATRNVGIGTAVAIAFPRSPAVTAMSAWTLQSLSGGRFILGLGTQVRAHIERRYGLAVRLQADSKLISPDFTLEKLKVATRNIVVDQKTVVSMGSIDLSDLNEVSANFETNGSTLPAPTEETEQIKKRRRRRRRNGKSRDIESEIPTSTVDEKVLPNKEGLEYSQKAKSEEKASSVPGVSESSSKVTNELEITEKKPESNDTKVSKKRKPRVNKDEESGSVQTGHSKKVKILSEINSSNKGAQKVVIDTDKSVDKVVKNKVKSKPDKVVKEAVKKVIINDEKLGSSSQKVIPLEGEKKPIKKVSNKKDSVKKEPVKKIPVKKIPVKKIPVKETLVEKVENTVLKKSESVESKEPKRKGWWST